MRQIMKKSKTLSLLSAAILCSAIAPARISHAETSGAASELYKQTAEYTADGGKIKVQTYSQKDGESVPQSLFYGETALSDEYSLVLHSVRQGGKYLLNTVSDIAADYEKTHAGTQVMMAINGGFFDGAFNNDEKLPEGALIEDGVLLDDGFRSKTNHGNAVGWSADGGFTHGSIKADTQVYTLRVTDRNGQRKTFDLRPDGSDLKNYGVCLYRAGETGAVANSVRYTAKIESNDGFIERWNQLERINETADSAAFTVAENTVTVVVREDFEAMQALDGATAIEAYQRTSDTTFASADYAVDIFNDLVLNGKAKAGFNGAGHATTPAPRTTIGYFADGRIFFSVADGRQDGYAKGLTCAEQAAFAAERGCAFAFELDGGGSSTFLVRKGGELVCLNRCSEGQQRKILDAVLVVKTEKQANYDKLLAKDELELTEGETAELPLAEGVDFSKLNVTVSDTSVIAVDENGKISALKKGIAQIDVSFGDKIESLVVQVKAAQQNAPAEEKGGCKGNVGYIAVFPAMICLIFIFAKKRYNN